MLFFDFSDQKLKILEVSPKIFGGEEVSLFVSTALKEGLIANRAVLDGNLLAQEVKGILQKAGVKVTPDTACALSLHDERVFTLRLKIDSDGEKDTAKLVNSQVDTFLPDASQERVSSFKHVGDDKDGEVQFIAADKNFFSGYLDLFKAMGLNLVLADPESYGVYWLLKDQIKEGETVIYLNSEAAAADIVIMDKWGVLQTFTGSATAADTEKKIREAADFIKTHWARTIGKIWIGGESPVNAAQLGKNLGVAVEMADKALANYPFPFGSKAAPANRLEIFHLLGLALLSRQKDALNLMAPV